MLNSNWKKLAAKASKKAAKLNPAKEPQPGNVAEKSPEKKRKNSRWAKKKKRPPPAATAEPGLKRKKVGGPGEAGANTPTKQESKLTSIVALDCEMVGVGPEGKRSALARCSVVSEEGEVLYDKFVKPLERVVDYRTAVSGITKKKLFGKSSKAITFAECQAEVHALLENRTVVGHALKNDFDALMLEHPRELIRDTAKCKLFCPHRPKSLKNLVLEILGLQVQSAQHSSVEDARAVLALYKSKRSVWEREELTRRRKERLKKAYKDGKLSSGTGNNATQGGGKQQSFSAAAAVDADDDLEAPAKRSGATKLLGF